MSDVGRKQDTAAAPPKRQFMESMLRDPVVRWMVYIAGGLVVLFLLTAVGALVTGVLSPTGPRNAAERDLQIAADAARAGAVGAQLSSYVDALVATGDLTQARVVLDRARASAPATMPLMALDLSEARILSAEQRYPDAVKMATKAMDGYKAQWEKSAETTTPAGIAIKAAGLPEGYFDAVLVRAYANVAQKKYKDAITLFDLYLVKVPTASDILIDRGNAKLLTNDKAGAEKDFRAALKYVPYDKDAKAGLKKIGVTQ